MEDLDKVAREWLEDFGQMTDHVDDYLDAFKAGYNHLMPELDKMANELFIQEGKLKEKDEYIARLQAQISRNIESLIKEGEM